VGNAVSSFLAARLRTIATLKCLGAPERLVFTTYFIQLAALTALGVGIGLAIGAALPFVASRRSPTSCRCGRGWRSMPAPWRPPPGFGLLVSLLFALVPLMRARSVSAATLMRGAVVQQGGRLAWRDALAIAAVAMSLAAFTIFTADSRRSPPTSFWARSAPSSPFLSWRGC
jgi:putative ABC transport system permease protein